LWRRSVFSDGKTAPVSEIAAQNGAWRSNF
jgi:hypothetical protein